MSKKYILALDQGTSSSRSLLFNSKAEVVDWQQEEFHQYYPKAGWVEHEPMEIWDSQISTAKKLIEKAKVDVGEIAGIGIANQRETIVVWDKTTGEPVYRAIVWQDKRTADLCKKLQKDGWNEYIKKNTGLVIDSYFSATKIHWILNVVPGIKEQAKKVKSLLEQLIPG